MSVYRDMARDAGCSSEDEIRQMAAMIEQQHRAQIEAEHQAEAEERARQEALLEEGENDVQSSQKL